MTASPVEARGEDGLRRMQAILSASIAAGGPRYVIHPGDLAWWVSHTHPQRTDGETYWLWDDWGFVDLDEGRNGFDAFTLPGCDIVPLIEWAGSEMGADASMGYVSDDDSELETILSGLGYLPSGHVMTLFTRDLAGAGSKVEAPVGWELRPLSGEDEADARRQASHAAFKSKVDPAVHLDMYLRVMRSSVYDSARDLVAVDADGRVGAFLVWWPDPSGIAQLEPVGTHPDFQRQGLGRALMDYACQRMAEAGMSTVRVATDDYRTDAMGFYAGTGFDTACKLRSWGKKKSS